MTITHSGAPASGSLVVNGQNFEPHTSPQEITLTGLSADGQVVNAVAHFSAEPSCSFTQNSAFTAPPSCASSGCVSFENNSSMDIPDESFVNSTINVPSAGTITDVNIKNLEGSHGFLEDLIFELTSPTGTKITLFSALCGSNGDGFNISLDDAASSAIMCPINDNQTEMPESPLSAFNGQEAMGDWVLTITDDGFGDVGILESWTLELCGDFGGGNDCDNPPPASGNIAAATYKNNASISTAGSILSPDVVFFKAKDCITLGNEFSVASGATLECNIEECDSSPE